MKNHDVKLSYTNSNAPTQLFLRDINVFVYFVSVRVFCILPLSMQPTLTGDPKLHMTFVHHSVLTEPKKRPVLYRLAVSAYLCSAMLWYENISDSM